MPTNTADPTMLYKFMTLLLLLPSFSLSYFLLLRYSKLLLAKVLPLDATWPPAFLLIEIILLTKLDFVPLLLVTALLVAIFMALYAIRIRYIKSNSS